MPLPPERDLRFTDSATEQLIHMIESVVDEANECRICGELERSNDILRLALLSIKQMANLGGYVALDQAAEFGSLLIGQSKTTGLTYGLCVDRQWQWSVNT